MRTVNLGEPTVGVRELDAVRAVVESGWLSGAGPPECRALEGELRSDRQRRIGLGDIELRFGAPPCLADSRRHSGRRGHRCRLHLSGHRSRSAMGGWDTDLRRRPPRQLGDRRCRGRSIPCLCSDRRDHRRRRVRAAGRLRRAASPGRFGRPLVDRGCCLRPRRHLSGSARRQPRRLCRVQLPRSEGRDGRRGRGPRCLRGRCSRPGSRAPHLRQRARLRAGRRRQRPPSRRSVTTSPLRDPGGDGTRAARAAARTHQRPVRGGRWVLRAAQRSRSGRTADRSARSNPPLGSPTCSPWTRRSTGTAVAMALRTRGRLQRSERIASHLQPVYNSAQRCPVSANLFSRHLAIPMHANLVEDDVGHGRRLFALWSAWTPPAPIVTDPPRTETKRMHRLETVFFTGGAGFIGMHVIPMLLERGYRVRVFDNMFRGDRDAMARLTRDGRRRADRPGHALRRRRPPGDEGLRSVIHVAAVAINKSQCRPVRVDGHQHDRRAQRLRCRGRPRRAPLGLRLQRLGLRRPQKICRCTRTTRCTR